MSTSPARPDLWPEIHDARRALVDDLSDLTDAQWHRPSLCGDWDIEHVVAHLTAVATVGRWAWLRSIVASGFRPSVHNDRRLGEHLGPTPADTLARFAEVATATTAPTRGTAPYLGEVLVHGQDARRPLRLPTPHEPAVWRPVAGFYAARDFAVDSRKVATGLRLVATDTDFTAGDGAEVSGTTEALVMTMAGRTAYLEELEGPGRQVLTDRLETR